MVDSIIQMMQDINTCLIAVTKIEMEFLGDLVLNIQVNNKNICFYKQLFLYNNNLFKKGTLIMAQLKQMINKNKFYIIGTLILFLFYFIVQQNYV